MATLQLEVLQWYQQLYRILYRRHQFHLQVILKWNLDGLNKQFRRSCNVERYFSNIVILSVRYDFNPVLRFYVMIRNSPFYILSKARSKSSVCIIMTHNLMFLDRKYISLCNHYKSTKKEKWWHYFVSKPGPRIWVLIRMFSHLAFDKV